MNCWANPGLILAITHGLAFLIIVLFAFGII